MELLRISLKIITFGLAVYCSIMMWVKLIKEIKGEK